MAVSATLRGAEPRAAIVLAAATSLAESGLLDHLLPIFTAATGIEVQAVALGTEQALDAARRGVADLVLADDPTAEQRFFDRGFGTSRRQIAWSDLVIVGPSLDPANVRGRKDAVAALAAIARAKVPFVSRGDQSDTNQLERRLWHEAGITPPDPADGWYRAVGGGMGAALQAAAATDAYALSDRSAWLRFGDKRDLVICVAGDGRLLNRYDAITLDPNHRPAARMSEAQALADWLVSGAGQTAIGEFRIAGQQVFHPSAAHPR
ncbi:MAG TPA: substrate-binding domain-containing protein [Stellaceae bacterium]|nr:substrate-binding domain-containing protein [Stellaceae bacterium]